MPSNSLYALLQIPLSVERYCVSNSNNLLTHLKSESKKYCHSMPGACGPGLGRSVVIVSLTPVGGGVAQFPRQKRKLCSAWSSRHLGQQCFLVSADQTARVVKLVDSGNCGLVVGCVVGFGVFSPGGLGLADSPGAKVQDLGKEDVR